MNGKYSILSRVSMSTRWPSFALQVGLSVGLIVLAPCAAQGLNWLRAAQYETNENRSECETNDRLHASIQSARSSKHKGRLTEFLSTSSQTAKSRNSLRRGLAATRFSVAAVVIWSPLMRC
jgi:hypothetical protein